MSPPLDSLATRVLDVAIGAALALLALPVAVVIAMLVVLDAPGPVLFVQARLGRGGVPFLLPKFRTLAHGRGGESPVAAADDDRVTRIGRRLRRTRLDELPQLLSVLAGDMSLVGPRPAIAENLAALEPAVRARRLSVRPGLTGAVALEFIGEDDVLAETADPVRVYRECLVPEKARRELEAIDDASLGAYLRVLARTPLVLGSGAARERSRRRVRALLARCRAGKGGERLSRPRSSA